MRILISTVALVACTGLASAADLGGPAYGGSIKDGPYAGAPFSWTGLYVGAHVGHGWGDWDVDLSHSSGAIHYNDPFVPAHGSLSADDGWLGGFQAGYNHQFGALVLGLEADASWTGVEADGRFVTPKGSAWDINTSLDVFGTVRGRIGYAFDRVMIYGTGGLAWGIVDAKQATNFVDQAGNQIDVGGRTSGDVNHIGWTAGAGIEWAFAPNWTVKGDYLYVDLGEENYSLDGTTKPGGDVPYTETFATDLSFHTVRLGVNYKFGR